MSLTRALGALSAAAALGALAACSSPAPHPRPEPHSAPAVSAPPRVDTVRATDTVPDPQQQRRMAELELRLLERDAQIERLEASLDAARRDVVRALARLQTTASRAEAAAAMAEADVALQALPGPAGEAGEVAQARQLIEMGTVEFNKRNYGGALYLANQVKALAQTGRDRLTAAQGNQRRPGETPFAVALPLRARVRANVREGPGLAYRILFTVERGTALAGQSYTQEWVRVRDATGRTGWVFRDLIGR